MKIIITSNGETGISIHGLTEYEVCVLIEKALIGKPALFDEQEERLDLLEKFRQAWKAKSGSHRQKEPKTESARVLDARALLDKYFGQK